MCRRLLIVLFASRFSRWRSLRGARRAPSLRGCRRAPVRSTDPQASLNDVAGAVADGHQPCNVAAERGVAVGADDEVGRGNHAGRVRRQRCSGPVGIGCVRIRHRGQHDASRRPTVIDRRAASAGAEPKTSSDQAQAGLEPADRERFLAAGHGEQPTAYALERLPGHRTVDPADRALRGAEGGLQVLRRALSATCRSCACELSAACDSCACIRNASSSSSCAAAAASSARLCASASAEASRSALIAA